MKNQYEDRDKIEELKEEQLLIKEKLELLSTLFDDLAKMYFNLEEDLFLSGKIRKKYSGDGLKYDIYKSR